MPDRAVVSNPTEGAVDHEEEELRFCFARVARQDNLKALGWHDNPQRTEVPVLLILPWLTVDVFADVLGEIPGQFDRGGSRSWLLHVYLTLRFPDDLVPTTSHETNVLESTDSQMWMDRLALLAFQHRHMGH
jgi:hypothetical protein